MPPERATPTGSTYNGRVCEAVGLYISLNQCSLSSGLVHRPVSVIISRQMNPTPGCPRPPEPPVQDESSVAFADTLFPMPCYRKHPLVLPWQGIF